MKKIKVLVINPNDRTITAQEIEPSLFEFYRIIDCTTIEANFGGVIGNHGHFLYVDEEGSFKKNKNYFHILGAPNALTGIGVLMQDDGKGNSTDCRFTVTTLKPFVNFYTEQELIDLLKPKFS